MVDIRPIAHEKARQKLNGENSRSTFESERQRAKSGARREAGMYTGMGVEKIAAYEPEEDKDKIIRVAAYCRVSTDDLEQVLSIELQKNAYRDKIKETKKWKYAGTYVDDGFSGTNTEHRPAFTLMMKDAMAGRFDMIITKSVSRFARNLLDCIGWVRKLQEHDPPIGVFFEQENLNTLDPTSSIILFVLAMVAEEESHMKSEAMLLSLEWRLSRGRFLTPKLLGYDKIVYEENGMIMKKLVINEEQAKTVQLMYYMLLSGCTTADIAETLTELGRETGGRLKDGSPNTHWTPTGIVTTMRNERYCGDVLARKTWTPNFHDHKSVKNRGKKNRYYQPAHHEAIITRAQWNAAQKILNSHRYAHSGTYLPMRVIDHGILCGYISINRAWAGFDDNEYYQTSAIAMGLTEGNLQADLENEHLPDGGHRISGLSDESGIQRITRDLSQAEKQIKAEMEGKSLEELEQEEAPKVKVGFQVANGNMFSHACEPVIRLSRKSLAFSSVCIGKLAVPYVEILYNPVERMLAVRPCKKEHMNAIRWSDDKGRSVSLGASAFCGLLFRMMNWNDEYTFRIPAMLCSHMDEKILFFDMDNFIGHETKIEKKPEFAETGEVHTDATGIFFSADEEEEPVEIKDMEELYKKAQENELRYFGKPVYEHDSGFNPPDTDEVWDLMAEAIALDIDHKVDQKVIDGIMDTMYGKADEQT